MAKNVTNILCKVKAAFEQAKFTNLYEDVNPQASNLRLSTTSSPDAMNLLKYERFRHVTEFQSSEYVQKFVRMCIMFK